MYSVAGWRLPEAETTGDVTREIEAETRTGITPPIAAGKPAELVKLHLVNPGEALDAAAQGGVLSRQRSRAGAHTRDVGVERQCRGDIGHSGQPAGSDVPAVPG